MGEEEDDEICDAHVGMSFGREDGKKGGKNELSGVDARRIVVFAWANSFLTSFLIFHLLDND